MVNKLQVRSAQHITYRVAAGSRHIVLYAFQQYGRLSWDDFFEMSIFKDAIWKNEGGTELKNILEQLIEERLIKPMSNDWLSWEYNLEK